MRILYKQTGQEQMNGMKRYGIQNCYFKKISPEQDRKMITKKVHCHTGFEMHIIAEGLQEYEVAGERYRLEGGSFLLIYPNTPHKVTVSEPHTEKYSITFTKQPEQSRSCLFGTVDERIFSDILFISKESSLKKEFSCTLIENSVLEILIWAFRLSGMAEGENVQDQDENLVISLAKQYISDNIAWNPRVTDVSKYSYLSTKQLTRIFQKFEGISPGEYIAKKRTKRIEELLAEDALTLKEISETMHFNSEYYFNAFFKKHAGMPPGAYRKMYGK